MMILADEQREIILEIYMFSKETRIAASMNEASSMPKGMKWSVVCVFKVFLTIYPRPTVRSG